MSESSSTPTSPNLTGSSPPSSVPASPQLDLKPLSFEVSEEDRAAAASLKADANKAFGAHDFASAADLYSQAIERNPNDATIWCNRAFARIKLEEFGYALSDCTQAIQLDPKYAKAFYRRALCQLQVLKPAAAVTDFRKVLALEPKNEAVRAQLTATQKLIKKIEFEKAIEVEGERSAVLRVRDIIAEGGCEVEKTYVGPILPFADGKYSITHEFITSMIEWFKQGKTLPKRYVWEIVLGAHDHFAAEESLVNVDIDEGVTCDVIGDVHGQFYDMLHLYSLTGEPNEKHYLLMNGDLVDRGSWSIEVILTAFAFKWLYPRYMYINRGNHEARDMNRTYGFEGEAKHKHGELSYKLFEYVFTALPLATLVSPTKPPSNKNGNPILSPEGRKRYFVVHGGLFSKDGVTLDEIRKISRIGRQPGQEGLMCELLWTDPQVLPGRGPSKRGVGIAFGPDVTKNWCTLNGVSGIIRSHEVRQGGYEIEHDGLCTTVFSAPNYVDQGGNKGAFIRIDAEAFARKTFTRDFRGALESRRSATDLDAMVLELTGLPSLETPLSPRGMDMFTSFLLAVLFILNLLVDARQWNNTGTGSIAFEEAYAPTDLIDLLGGAHFPPTLMANLEDIHNQRLQFMDEAAVDFVVLSCVSPGPQGISNVTLAQDVATKFNDELAATISNNTLRFGAFAALSMHDPSQAAAELRRTVQELGFLGALLNDYQVSGPDNDTLLFYDQPEYDVFWEAVAELNVPVYLHPRSNIPQIQTPLYSHAVWLEAVAQEYAATLSTHILGLCANGVFDRFPSLQILVGHLGERVPSDLWRIDNALAGVIGSGGPLPPMNQTIDFYLKHNILETTSGNFATPLLQFHASQIGMDRILYSVDYPFVAFGLGQSWLENLTRVLEPQELLALKRGRAIEVLHLDDWIG
uniref:Serine/threonine-protein phosphatase n=1 Tax=Mycena chlorophos TaxID=658473 RepID=A0ABQ0L2U5_MYCCL|nr:phosphoprotein phosphatase [Mycena chlorophos]